MTRFELRNKVEELGFTYMHHQAMTGSEYITINGQRYRLADHSQPSHYQIRNYIDCKSNEQILDLAVKAYQKSLEINTTDEYLYDDKRDGFYPNPNYSI
jgi:hypothetical protein